MKEWHRISIGRVIILRKHSNTEKYICNLWIYLLDKKFLCFRFSKNYDEQRKTFSFVAFGDVFLRTKSAAKFIESKVSAMIKSSINHTQNESLFDVDSMEFMLFFFFPSLLTRSPSPLCSHLLFFQLVHFLCVHTPLTFCSDLFYPLFKVKQHHQQIHHTLEKISYIFFSFAQYL